MKVSSTTVSFGNRIIKNADDLKKTFKEVTSNKITTKEFVNDVMNIKMPKKDILETATKLEQENPKNKPFVEMLKGFIARLSD